MYGCVPRGPIDLGVLPDTTRDHGEAVEFVSNVNHIRQLKHDNIQLASAKYKEAADRHMRDVQFSA